MKNNFLIITSNDIDDGKKTPKKFDIYDKNDKIEDNYILLGKRINLMKKKIFQNNGILKINFLMPH